MDINAFSAAKYYSCFGSHCPTEKQFQSEYFIKPGPLFFTTAAFISFFFLLIFLRPPALSIEQATPIQPEPILWTTIEGLRYRARRLRKGGVIALLLIITSLIVGIGIFLSAGYLASAEALSFNPVLAEISRSNKAFRETLSDMVYHQRSFREDLTTMIKHKPEAIEKTIKEIKYFGPLPTDIQETQSEGFARLEGFLQELRDTQRTLD
jgi:hypothetical protein